MKRVLSYFLAIILVFSSVTPVFAQDDFVKKENSAKEELELQNNGVYSEKDTIDVIVELKTENFSEFGKNLSAEELRDRKNIEKQIDFARKSNKKALVLIDKLGINFKKGYDLEVITVGFTGTTTYGDALKLAEQDYIKRVNISVSYNLPEVEVGKKKDDAEKPRMMTSKYMVGNSGLYTKYDGAGSVVAVLDSGTDVNHETFYLTENGKAKTKISRSDLSKVTTNGTYFSEKIPFGYSYADNRNSALDIIDKEGSKTLMHGQHVAATAVGNHVKLTLDNKPMDFSGIAPEAQLLAMKVFNGSGTQESWYVPAIDDAVKLGADSINLSLGGPMGSQATVGRGVDEAIEKASQIGCIVAIAAGNDGHAGYPYMPVASNPDYGVTQAPAVAMGGLTVSALENTNVLKDGFDHGSKKYYEFPTLLIYDGTNITPVRKSILKTSFTGTFINDNEINSFIDVGFADNPSKLPDLKGKIALVERGETDILEVIKNLEEKNARGILLFNDAGRKERIEYIEGVTSVKPWIGSISREAGLFLKKNPSYRFAFTNSEAPAYLSNPAVGRISDFSAWGVTADGFIKPDIMAPGGEIYSAINTVNATGYKYQYMSGTSMATPHVAGGIALIRSRIEREFSNLSGKDKFYLLRNLLMSTATVHKNIYTDVTSSPRQQGAGLMNLDAAASAKAVLYDSKTRETKINLGDVNSTIDFSFKIKNLTSTPVTYNYKTSLTTNEVKDGKFTLNPVLLDTIKGSSITVAGGEEKTIAISFDVSKYHEDLIKKMRNGYWLEGFVELESTGNEPALSIPFSGFKGNFKQLPVIEPFIYELTKYGELPVYYNSSNHPVDFTGMFSEVDGKPIILGQEYEFDKDNPKFHDPVISPNNDGKVEDFKFTVVFDRNTNLYKARVNKLDGDQKTLVEELQDRNFFMKHYRIGARNGISYSNYSQKFPNNSGKPVDGKYELEFETLPVMEGASPVIQRQVFYVDTVKPKIVNVKLQNDKLSFDGLDELTGILYKEAYIGYNKLDVDENGNFIVPPGTRLSDITVKTYDYGYNETSGPADTFKETAILEPEDGKGSISLNTVVKDSNEVPTFIAKAIGPDGTEYSDLNNLPIGVYTIEIVDLEKGYILENQDPIKVEIRKDNLNPTVDITFVKEKLQKQLISIGLFSKYSVTVTSSDEVGKVSIYKGNQIDSTKALVENVAQGTISLREYNLRRGDLLTFVIKAEGYEDVVTTRRVRR
ncbi:S8 family serine peptidase [Lagierella sp.]|uniref:S8 family serine peptidase n=1 Tax=Lagierella sp. TaxID=2849657 RepID=UPI002625F83E|nr:S8 family serine peptidase [Lagierella sp.]